MRFFDRSLFRRNGVGVKPIDYDFIDCLPKEYSEIIDQACVGVAEVVEDCLTREYCSYTTSFDSLGADSLDRLEIIMALQERFGLEIDDEAAEKIITVGDAIIYALTHEHREYTPVLGEEQMGKPESVNVYDADLASLIKSGLNAPHDTS